MKECYRGILVRTEDGRDGPDLVMVPLGTPAGEWEDYLKQYIFHTGEGTRFCVSREELLPGVELAICHNGIATRSLPPQGFALAVETAHQPGGSVIG